MNTRIDLSMKSVRSLFRPTDFISAVALQCEMLPEYLPQKFGWFEPLKLVFDSDNLEALIPLDRNGRADTVWWKRTGKQRANGSWRVRWKSSVDYLKDIHSTIDVTTFDTKGQAKLLAYLKIGSVRDECDFGFLDGITNLYKPYAMRRGISDYGDDLSTTTHELRHWLPDMMWATVFGPAYVRMFGKERLLTAPAYVVEDIGPESVYIQLTPKLDDIYDKFDEVMAARERVKEHLGKGAFYQPELAYNQRQYPEKAGQVFRVPEFHLFPD